MSKSTFESISREMFRLYHDKAYAEAYALVVREQDNFPDNAGRLLYWQACFACLLGDAPQGLKVLQTALAAGHWYAPDQLQNDPDLKNLQGRPEFEQIVAVCHERLATAQQNGKPELHTFVPPSTSGPYPLLMALHGHGLTAEMINVMFLDKWQVAVSSGWMLAAPLSSLIVGPNQYGWGDFDHAKVELQSHYATLSQQHRLDPQRFVVGGFSRGAVLAIWLALTGVLPVQGFVAVAPGGAYISQPDLWKPILEAMPDRSVRGYLFIGEQDTPCYPGTCALADLLTTYGVAHELETQTDLGHDFPSNFEQSLPKALNYILQN